MVLTTGGSLSLSQVRSEFYPESNNMNTFNYYNKMTIGVTSGNWYPAIQSTDPTVQIQLLNNSSSNFQNIGLYYAQNLQELYSFTISFELFSANAAGDGFCIYFGGTSPTFQQIPQNSACGFNFQIYNGGAPYTPGINFVDTTGTTVIFNATTGWINAVSWIPVSITYQRGTYNTWTINYNGSLLYTYSDPQNQNWISKCGNYWGFGGFCGGAHCDQYIRKVTMTTSNSISKTLVNSLDWYNLLTIYHRSGGFTSFYENSDPLVQCPLSNATTCQNTIYNLKRIQDNSSFVLSFNFKNGANSGGNLGIFFGVTDYTNGNAYINGFVVEFRAFTTSGSRIQGINLFDSTSTVVASSATTGWINADTFYPVTITYTRGTTNTWVINYNGVNVINYSDSGNSTWLSSTSGNYWGFYGESNTCYWYVNQVNLTYTPQSISMSDLQNIAAEIGNGSMSLSNLYKTKNTNLSIYNTLAIDQGAYNMSPWNNSTFPDTSARWLWNTASASSSAPGGVAIVFQIAYTNTSSNVSATLYFGVDNCGYIYQNKILIGQYTGFSTALSIQVIIYPGKNLFEFVCWNQGAGPAAMIFTCINGSSTVLFRSDNASATSLTNSTKTTVPLAIDGSYNSYIEVHRPLVLNTFGPLDNITTTSKSALRGAYSCARLSLTYTGPTLNLRRSSDNATSDFYADIGGQLFTSTGATLSSWLGANTAYVVTWYDQSGSGNHATQSTTSAQPVYPNNSPAPYQMIDFGNSSNQFLNIPSGTVPVGTLNAPYTFIVKHGFINSSNGCIIGAGISSGNQSNVLRVDNGYGYYNYWWFNDYGIGSNHNNGNTVSVTFDGSTRSGYVNGVAQTPMVASGSTTSAGQQYIGFDANNEWLNGQIYYIYIFGSSISTTDITKLTTVGI